MGKSVHFPSQDILTIIIIIHSHPFPVWSFTRKGTWSCYICEWLRESYDPPPDPTSNWKNKTENTHTWLPVEETNMSYLRERERESRLHNIISVQEYNSCTGIQEKSPHYKQTKKSKIKLCTAWTPRLLPAHTRDTREEETHTRARTHMKLVYLVSSLAAVHRQRENGRACLSGRCAC